MSEGGRPDEYWFCTKHHRVETVENLCPAKHRLGPYGTEAQAARALEIAQERNEAWEAADRDDDEPSS
ncbi:hypothetical protein K8Z61_04175 [Nocardioides sp. TRM66260-LWL]|uniref:hypothetical protein n=1 Tax=Nocardioides sp. TRM66260-LWL TaxID=2874478 RepID=UPI001CC7D7DD|nr:hypothetical protein [Nocardioides sp. TRM66260-LWL]MBZ5733684.1 hypothetical protein [Nocardioides sp. TRM66260-LWL]